MSRLYEDQEGYKGGSVMTKLKFYPLYHEEYLTLRSQLKPNELDLYLYLVTKNPFEDSKIEIDTALISEQLGYHRRTIQIGINKLAYLNLLEFEVTSFKYRRKAKHGCNSCVTQRNKGESVDRQGESVDRQGESVDRQGESVDRQGESVDRQEKPEPLFSMVSKTPHTKQTNTDYLYSLKQERERETLEKEKKEEKIQIPAKEKCSSQEEIKSPSTETEKVKTEFCPKDKFSAPPKISVPEEFQRELINFGREIGKRSPGGWASQIIRSIQDGIVCTYFDEWKAGIPIGLSDQQEYEVSSYQPYPNFREYLVAHCQKKEPNRVQASRDADAILRDPVQARSHWEDFKYIVKAEAERVEKQRTAGVQTPYMASYLTDRPEVTTEEAVKAAQSLQANTHQKQISHADNSALPATQEEEKLSAEALNQMISTETRRNFGKNMILRIAKENGYKVIQDEQGLPLQVIDPQQEEMSVESDEVKAVDPANGSNELTEITSEPTSEETEDATEEISLPATEEESSVEVDRPTEESLNELLNISFLGAKEYAVRIAERHGFIIYRDKETGEPLKIFDPENFGDEEF